MPLGPLAAAKQLPAAAVSPQQPDRSLGDAFESFLTEACGSCPHPGLWLSPDPVPLACARQYVQDDVADDLDCVLISLCYPWQQV